MKHNLKYNEKRNIDMLANYLGQNVYYRTKVFIVAKCTGSRLMLLPFPFGLIKWIFGKDRFENGLFGMLVHPKISTEMGEQMFQSILDHLLTMKWDEKEFNRFIEILVEAKVNPPFLIVED